MPVRPLPENPNLDHLKYQAKDLLKAHAAHDPAVAQRIREFHPRFRGAADVEIFESHLKLSDAQLTIAREAGFPSWARVKRRIEKPTRSDQLNLPHHERIQDPVFRHAVDLIDAGDTAGLSSFLRQHPKLVHQRVIFEGGNYFRNPTLLEFVAENPIRHGKMPANVVEIAKIILDARPSPDALNETLGLVATGRIPRECRQQIPLMNLLCDHGVDPASAIYPAILHGELEAANALIARGARINLPLAAALGQIEDARGLLPAGSPEDRHLAFALAAQFGRAEIVRLLLDTGENPDRYNPLGAHSHSTPLHQAAFAGHMEVVKLLVERGARLDLEDVLWHGTPAGWARYGGKTEVEAFLLSAEAERRQGK